MQTYSTRQVPRADKLSYWNSVTSDVFAPLEIRAHSRDFDADVSCVDMGRAVLSNVVSLPATVERPAARPLYADDRKFFLHTQLRGRLLVSQDGKEAILEPGDLALCDSSQPYTLHYEEPCSTLILSTSARNLKLHLPNPEEMLGVRLSGAQGLSHTVSVMLNSLWTQVCHDLPPDVGSRIADSVLDVLATTWLVMKGVEVSESAVCGSRRVLIKRHIENNLRDPELTTRTVAAAFNISVRYLHIIFASEQETVCNYITRRRLEQCARQLLDPLWRNRTITELALSWGFSNPTHFARVFRERFNHSPREYRNRAAQLG